MSLPFLAPNDPLLIKVAKPVPLEQINSKEIQRDIETMLAVAHGDQKDPKKKMLVGLAAPQIGISKRIILVDIEANGKGNLGDLHVYINPEIIWKSEESAEWYEGCFSTGSVCGIVSRSQKIKIKAYSLQGKIIEEEYAGYVARIFQHEIDHLNGIEFVNHIEDDSKLHWVEDDEFPQYRNQEAWRHWPNKCPRSKWEKIKKGHN